MGLVITKPDDTALTGIAFSIERGVPSSHVAVKIKNTGALAVVGSYLSMSVESSPGSGVYVTSGQRAVDELMGRFQVTGQDSTATPGQTVILGQTQVMGHQAVAPLPTILPGDWILADVWLEQPQNSTSGGAVKVKFEVAGDSNARPLPEGVTQVGSGVLPGVREARSFLISGRDATATTPTPDDNVNIAPGSWLLAGQEYTDPTTWQVLLDKTDFNGANLASGESYWAVITQGTASAPVATKGVKATTPAHPTPPAGQIILATVQVHYNGGSQPAIATGDITQTLVYGRLRVTGTGARLGTRTYYLVDGMAPSAAGTPDGNVYVGVTSSGGDWNIGGTAYTRGSGLSAALNQNDGAAAALTAGQSYIAAITLPPNSAGPLTTTKGLKATSPTKPALPANQPLVCYVTVHYNGSGSIINTVDIDDERAFGPLVVIGGGLTVMVHSGEALAQGFIQYRGAPTTVNVTASATSTIWLDINGSIVVNTTGAHPSPGAHKLATVIANATDVISIVDARTFVPGGSTLVPHAATHAAAGTDPISVADLGVAPLVHTHAEADVTGLVADLATLTATKAALASPVFTGDPHTPYPPTANNSIAPKLYVDLSVGSGVLKAQRTVGVLGPASSGATIPLTQVPGYFGGQTWAADGSTGDFTVKLPSNGEGPFTIIKSDVSANAITVTPYVGFTIAGGNYLLSNQYDSVTLVLVGLIWYIVAATP